MEAKGLRLEVVLYGIIILLGAGLRFGGLGGFPLEASEGLRALGGWQLTVGENPQLWREPLVEVLTAASFFLGGDSDFTARLVPALSGIALVASAWLLRRLIGREGALVTAFLLAVSPLLIFFSRSLSGASLGATLSLLLAIFLFNYLKERRPFFLGIAGVTLALLLNCGPLAFTTILILALFLALSGREAREALRPVKRGDWANLALISLGLFILVSTGFLSYPEGLGLPSLGAWIEEFQLQAGGQPWYYSGQVMATYEPTALLFGLFGAGYLLYRYRSPSLLHFPLLLSFWAVGGLFLTTISGQKSPEQMVSLVLPLTILSGNFIGELITLLSGESWRRGGPLLALGLVVGGVTLLLISEMSQGGAPQQGLILLAVSLALLLGLSIGMIGQKLTPLWGLALFSLGLLFTVHTIVSLNYYPTATELIAKPLSGDVVRLSDEVRHELSRAGAPKGGRVLVEASLKEPLAWYLRGLEVSYSPQVSPGAGIIIASSEAADRLPGYTKYPGMLSSKGTPRPGLSGLWRWLIYRETSSLEREGLTLYIKR